MTDETATPPAEEATASVSATASEPVAAEQAAEVSPVETTAPVTAEVPPSGTMSQEVTSVAEEEAPVETLPAEPEHAPVSESAPAEENLERTLPSVESSPASTQSSSPAILPSIATRRSEALEKRRAQKQERLEKIVTLARGRGKITNNDVQLLLAVADATATNYLNQLVLVARLKRVGEAEHARYEPL